MFFRNMEIKKTNKKIHKSGDIESEEVHEDKKQNKSGKHDPELAGQKSVEYFTHIVNHFMFSSVIPYHMTDPYGSQNNQEADDKIRIGTSLYGKIHCEI